MTAHRTAGGPGAWVAARTRGALQRRASAPPLQRPSATPLPGTAGPATTRRATSPVVGVVVLVGVAVVLAATSGALLAFGQATAGPAPRADVAVTVDATDGWPGGQRIRLTHRAGDALAVGDLALVVSVDRADVRARLTGFPTRRLTDGNVDGRDVFDNGFAGVDGALDAAHTDGTWTSGETASVRIAQGQLDLRSGDPVGVWLVHRPTGTVLARQTVRATGS